MTGNGHELLAQIIFGEERCWVSTCNPHLSYFSDGAPSLRSVSDVSNIL